MLRSGVLILLIFCGCPTYVTAADAVLRYGKAEAAGISPEVLQPAVANVEQSIAEERIHGAVLLVARNGQIVLHEALGWRDVENRLPMQKDTLFKMASNTKPVITTAIMQCVDDGRLKLDAPVGKYLPSWNEQPVASVTVRQLLNHTSGLRIPGVFVRPLLEKSEERPHAPSLGAEVDRFAEIGIEHEPGSTFSYNNPGFQVLGRLIEVASGQPLKEYLKKSIYRPLKMEDSWNHESDAPQERMSRVYSWKEGRRVLRWKPEDGPDWPIVRASGGMISTARDYATFCQMYLNEGVYGGKRLLKRASVRRATTVQTRAAHSAEGLAERASFYGLGWVVDRNGVFSHSGSDGTKAWVDPRRNLIVLVFTQSPGGDHPRDPFFRAVLAACDAADAPAGTRQRPRLRDLGVTIGVLPTGPGNTLTDVEGVQVGHKTLIRGDSIRTGVTVVKPHVGNVFLRKVPAALHVTNGFGKLVGATQIEELGVLESPIVLTNTLSTFVAADALVQWSLDEPGCESVLSVNPVVGECNDGYLNDIRRPIARRHVLAALGRTHAGAVAEGCVGAGTGVRCLGWKGGIGSSSRRLPPQFGGYTVGVLVQTNFGGSLTIAGVPVGQELGRHFLKEELEKTEHGSCMVIVATDAPLDARRLKRLARRAGLGLAAVGSPVTHGSGDYVLAFSTAKQLQTDYHSASSVESVELLRDDRLSPLFQAARDATEEAIVNSLLKAVSTNGRNDRSVAAIDPDRVVEIMQRFRALPEEADGPTADSMPRSGIRTYGDSRVTEDLQRRIDRLEQALPKLMQEHAVPGVSVAIVSDRRLAWSRGYGLRCAGSRQSVRPDTVMEACSMSKPFFAYVVLQLVERDRFDLDRPLVEYLGEDYIDADPRHRDITARMVLTHTTGWPNWRPGGWRSEGALKLRFMPGTQFGYSGEGFLMLQRVIERVLTTNLESLSNEQLIAPLKLQNTRFTWDDRFLVQAACGHDREGQVKNGRRYYDQPNAAFTLYTTAEDYARFLEELLRDDRQASHSLSASTVREMFTAASHREDRQVDWGLGWGLDVLNERTKVFHSGANGTGFRCYCEFFPQTGDGLVIMTNALAGDDLWRTLVEDWHAG